MFSCQIVVAIHDFCGWRIGVGAEPVPLSLKAGEFRQRLMKLNNETSLETYGFGVKWQKVELLPGKILITERHARIPALTRLDGPYRPLTRLTDLGLLDVNKTALKKRLEADLGLNVLAVFKDYDPESETAVTVILLPSQTGRD